MAVFNESNIKEGSVNISGIKESEMFTGVDVSPSILQTTINVRQSELIQLTQMMEQTEVSLKISHLWICLE